MTSNRAARIIASGLGSGFSPKAPGTCGSLAALLIWWVASISVSALGLERYQTSFTIFFVVLCIVAGFWSVGLILSQGGDSANGELSKAERDPQWIVIDEWAGMAISLVAVSPNSLFGVTVAFALFRVFDASKFWLVGVAERFPGALGVMLDDVVAGAFAFLGVALLTNWI